MRCEACGTEHEANFCPNCGSAAGTASSQPQQDSLLECPKCHSHNVNVHPVTETKVKNRGCFGWLLWIFLAVITCGLIIIIPLLTNTKSKSVTRTEAVCQNCGKRWRVK